MSVKEFIPYDIIRNNAIALAHDIYRSGFVPDVIYVSPPRRRIYGQCDQRIFQICPSRTASGFFTPPSSPVPIPTSTSRKK